MERQTEENLTENCSVLDKFVHPGLLSDSMNDDFLFTEIWYFLIRISHPVDATPSSKCLPHYLKAPFDTKTMTDSQISVLLTEE